MTSILLFLASQTLAAPIPKTPPNTSPSIYALVFVEKRPLKESYIRKKQMRYEAGHCRSVLDNVLRMETVSRLKIVKKQENAKAWLEKNLRVDSLEDTGVLRISVADGSPMEQVIIANAIAKAYLQHVDDRDRRNRERSIAELDERYADIKERIDRVRVRIVKLNEVPAKNEDERKRILREREHLALEIAGFKEMNEQHKKEIRERQEYLRRPYCILLQRAELPLESK